MIANRHGVSPGDNENVLKLIVIMVAQPSHYIKKNKTQLKWMNCMASGRTESLPLTDSVAFIDTHCFVLHIAFGPLQFPAPVLKCVKHYCMVLGIRS